jgi:PIN domain nuclease of toxin-antitoxin system
LSERLPEAARALIDRHDARISPLTVLELAYLQEIGRARDRVQTMLAALRRDIGAEVADVSLTTLAQSAVDLHWTRDPFDRMISAHAIVENAPLLTADRTIRDNLPLATWD